MINEAYDYIAQSDKSEYFFVSEGENRKILKRVQFTPFEENVWNLAFGDYQEGDIDDSVISNNHDVVRIFNTIAKIVYEYSETYPSRHIFIRPVDEKRKKLYNHIFRRNHKTISLTFDVIGTSVNTEYDYSPNIFFDIFILKRKFVQ